MASNLLVSRKSVDTARVANTSSTTGDGRAPGARGFDLEGAIGWWLRESQEYQGEQWRLKEEERQAKMRELAQWKELGEKQTELLNQIVNTQSALASQQKQMSQLMAMLAHSQVAERYK